MARRYDIEELLWLRNSPLVSKPDKLPPIEEWMGPIPDPTARKPNHRDQNQNDNGAPRRPSLFEPGHVSRKSNSGDDIVLGPPKTSFASASRIHGKGSHDTTEYASRLPDTDEVKGDRFNFREKYFKDREGADRDSEKREGRFVNPNGRRNDREDWNTGRPRRTFGQEESEQRPRRNGETSRWEPREKQDDSGFSRTVRDKDGRFDKDGRYTKRDGPLRGRHEPSWFRDDNGGEGVKLEEEKQFRNREWRRDKQLPDRDWNRGAKVEQDPEWMDSTDRDEPRQVHTQEDFQRWKERMKAGSATPTQAEEKKDTAPEPVSLEAQAVETNHLNGELFAASKSHMQVDAGFDKFFGLLGDTKATTPEASNLENSESNKRDSSSAKMSKSSRFAGLFSPPPPDTTVRGAEKAPVTSELERPASTDADQEGFQRILQMLGNSKSRNTTPQVDSSKQPRPPSYVMSEQSRPTPPPGLSSPGRHPMNRPDEIMAAQEIATARAMQHHPPGIGAPLSSRDPQAQFNDRENLLRLMQQVNISPLSGQHTNVLPPPPPPLPPQQQQPQLSQGGHTPGILNVPDLLSRPQGMQKMPRNQNFLDDPAIANMQRPDAGLKGPQARKPPMNGPGGPMRFFEDVPYPGLAQGAPGLTTPGGTGAGREPQAPHSHMGLQRPPGFDQGPPGPPPGWAGQMPPQQGILGPPPGIPNPNKGVNSNFMGGPLSMHGANMPPPGENPQFARGNMGGAGSAGNFGLPPGMMPPPGYMNMNGPPPPTAGFMPGPGPGPGPHNHEAMLNVGGQNGFGDVTGRSSGPPPSSRHLLEMLAHANGGDGRGAMLGGGPGQFR